VVFERDTIFAVGGKDENLNILDTIEYFDGLKPFLREGKVVVDMDSPNQFQ